MFITPGIWWLCFIRYCTCGSGYSHIPQLWKQGPWFKSVHEQMPKLWMHYVRKTIDMLINITGKYMSDLRTYEIDLHAENEKKKNRNKLCKGNVQSHELLATKVCIPFKSNHLSFQHIEKFKYRQWNFSITSEFKLNLTVLVLKLSLCFKAESLKGEYLEIKHSKLLIPTKCGFYPPHIIILYPDVTIQYRVWLSSDSKIILSYQLVDARLITDQTFSKQVKPRRYYHNKGYDSVQIENAALSLTGFLLGQSIKFEIYHIVVNSIYKIEIFSDSVDSYEVYDGPDLFCSKIPFKQDQKHGYVYKSGTSRALVFVKHNSSFLKQRSIKNSATGRRQYRIYAYNYRRVTPMYHSIKLTESNNMTEIIHPKELCMHSSYVNCIYKITNQIYDRFEKNLFVKIIIKEMHYTGLSILHGGCVYGALSLHYKYLKDPVSQWRVDCTLDRHENNSWVNDNHFEFTSFSKVRGIWISMFSYVVHSSLTAKVQVELTYCEGINVLFRSCDQYVIFDLHNYLPIKGKLVRFLNVIWHFKLFYWQIPDFCYVSGISVVFFYIL